VFLFLFFVLLLLMMIMMAMNFLRARTYFRIGRFIDFTLLFVITDAT